MFSQTTEYALRATVHIAEHRPKRLSVTQIAQATGAPSGYLAKVLQSLSRAGVVVGQRGLHGGFTLTREPEAISILEIMNAVDPIPRIKKCPLDNPEHAEQLCPLHRRLDAALEKVEDGFRRSTLADLLAETTFESAEEN